MPTAAEVRPCAFNHCKRLLRRLAHVVRQIGAVRSGIRNELRFIELLRKLQRMRRRKSEQLVGFTLKTGEVEQLRR